MMYLGEVLESEGANHKGLAALVNLYGPERLVRVQYKGNSPELREPTYKFNTLFSRYSYSLTLARSDGVKILLESDSSDNKVSYEESIV